jgi:heme/copper-type cytochrome/quinol oxidase subunit 4
MHARKKEIFLGFVLMCVFVLAFAVATIREPNVIFVAFLVVSISVALFGAYRLFCFSDDWYRAQEEKEQRWYARHPYLTLLGVVLGAGGCLWQLFDMVRRLLR